MIAYDLYFDNGIAVYGASYFHLYEAVEYIVKSPNGCGMYIESQYGLRYEVVREVTEDSVIYRAKPIGVISINNITKRYHLTTPDGIIHEFKTRNEIENFVKVVLAKRICD